MMHARAGLGAFEFVVLSSLRVVQLVRGCTPRVPSTHKHVTTAQLEVAAGMVVGVPPVTVLSDKSVGRL
jgi:hypothetical protein